MKLIDYTDERSFSSRLRKRRLHFLTDFVKQVNANTQNNVINILDLGGTITYWKIFPFQDFGDIQFNITLLNLEYPNYDNKNHQIADNVVFHQEIGNACFLDQFLDKSWDIIHSNSVIEHVGSWRNIQLMANEIHRVGKNYFLQTPNYWFPIEPHFILPFYQFFPRPIRIFFLMKKYSISLDRAILTDETIRLLTHKELSLLFSKSTIKKEYFFGLTKSFIALELNNYKQLT